MTSYQKTSENKISYYLTRMNVISTLELFAITADNGSNQCNTLPLKFTMKMDMKYHTFLTKCSW